VYVSNSDSASSDAFISVFDRATRSFEPATTVLGFPEAVGIAVHPADGVLYAARPNNRGASLVSFVDLETHVVDAGLSFAARPTAVALTADGTTALVAVSGDQLDAVVVDAAEQRVANSIPLGAPRLRSTVTIASTLFTCAAIPAVAPCAGDCDADEAVSVAEIVRGIAIALGTGGLGTCTASDANGDGEVTIDDLLRAIGAALHGCVG